MYGPAGIILRTALKMQFYDPLKKIIPRKIINVVKKSAM